MSTCPDADLCLETTNEGGDVGLAFGLTIIAGLSTTFGSLVPFLPFVKRDDMRFLAGGLGLSAGVMLYVSFAEILMKSQHYFCCVTEKHYALAATGCFFAGVVFTILLHLFVHFIQHSNSFRKCWNKINHQILKLSVRKKSSLRIADQNDENALSALCMHEPARAQAETQTQTGDSSQFFLMTTTASEMASRGELTNAAGTDYSEKNRCSSGDDQSDLVKAREGAGVVDAQELDEMYLAAADILETTMGIEACSSSSSRNSNEIIDTGMARHQRLYCDKQVQVDFSSHQLHSHADSKRLQQMGLMTGLAIAIHNFPEGLATFIATLADSRLGVVLCIAIALHNIPEGVAVSLPVYFATGSRRKAFMWSFISGLSEPIGALIGWLLLRSTIGHTLYGVIFGMVAGMMVYVVIKELLPTAHRYDLQDKLVTKSFMIGALVMSLSLLLFHY